MKRSFIYLLFLSLVVSVPLWAGHTPKAPKEHAEAPEPGEANKVMTFTVTPGEDLVVDTSGDIQVTTWDQDQVVVTAMDLGEGTRLTANHTGKIVRVNSRGEYAELFISIPSKFGVDLVTASGEVRITGSLSGKINATTGGGDIDLDAAAGEIDLRTSGGVISAKAVDGNAQLHSAGGEIYVGSVTGNLDIQTGGGDVSVKDVGKNLTAKTGGGNMDAGNVSGTAALSTGGGDVTIGNVHGQLTASTGGGNIEAGKVDSSATLKTSGGDIEIRGATGMVIAKSSGGNITAENINGSLDASTSGGDVTAKLRPSGTGESAISSAGGDITLYVPETAKAKIDATIRIRGRWELRAEESDLVSDFKAASFEKNEEGHEIHGVYLLNGGGETISLETVNSNITIKALK